MDRCVVKIETADTITTTVRTLFIELSLRQCETSFDSSHKCRTAERSEQAM